MVPADLLGEHQRRRQVGERRDPVGELAAGDADAVNVGLFGVPEEILFQQLGREPVDGLGGVWREDVQALDALAVQHQRRRFPKPGQNCVRLIQENVRGSNGSENVFRFISI